MAIGIALTFAAAILIAPNAGVVWHELAGLALLVLIGTGSAAAARTRASEPGPFRRMLGALAALILTGVAGFLISVGVVPVAFALLPVAGIVVIVALLLDSIRVGRR